MRLLLAIATLLLPTLSLTMFGGLYLWEKGWLLWWALASLLVAAIVTWLLSRRFPAPVLPQIEAGSDAGTTPAPHAAIPEEYASLAERRAWADVDRIARTADTNNLTSIEAVAALGQQTIEAVAARMHPEKQDALWQFTIPEALSIVERVSGRLADVTLDHVPLGDRLTVAQFLAAYRWRHAIDAAETAYDIWRVIRLANPATAVTNEARERLSRAMLTWGREHVMRRLTHAYVEEVGRAAIDLYSGRLRTARTTARAEAAAAAAPPPPAAAETTAALAPLSVLVLGSAPGTAAAAAALERALNTRNTGAAYTVAATTAVNSKRARPRQLRRDVAAADILVWLVDAAAGVTAGDVEAHGLVAAEANGNPRAVHAPQIVAVAGLDDASLTTLAARAGPLSGSHAGHDGPNHGRATVVALASQTDCEPLARFIVELSALAHRVAAARERARRDHDGVFAAARQVGAASSALAGAILRRKPR